MCSKLSMKKLKYLKTPRKIKFAAIVTTSVIRARFCSGSRIKGKYARLASATMTSVSPTTHHWEATPGIS